MRPPSSAEYEDEALLRRCGVATGEDAIDFFKSPMAASSSLKFVHCVPVAKLPASLVTPEMAARVARAAEAFRPYDLQAVAASSRGVLEV